jgi:hypothetical protein
MYIHTHIHTYKHICTHTRVPLKVSSDPLLNIHMTCLTHVFPSKFGIPAEPLLKTAFWSPCDALKVYVVGVNMYVWMLVCMYVCIRLDALLNTVFWPPMYVCMHVCAYVCMHEILLNTAFWGSCAAPKSMFVCKCMFIYMYVCMYVCMYVPAQMAGTCVCMYKQANIHT